MYKIDKSTQTVIWDYCFNNVGGCLSTPTLAEDGTIYFSAKSWGTLDSGSVYAINSDGTLKWQFNPLNNNLGFVPLGSGLIGSNGDIFSWGVVPNEDTCCFFKLSEQDAVLSQSPWPMYRHDEFHTGLGENQLVPIPQIMLQPQMLDFGFIMPGNQAQDTICVFNIGEIALEIEWALNSETFQINEIINLNSPKNEFIQPGDSLLIVISFSPLEPQLFKDTLFINSNDPVLPNIDFILKGKSSLEGDIKWSLQLSEIASSPAVDDYGTIYMAGWNTLWAITQEGEIKWEYEIPTNTDYIGYKNITISNNNQHIYLPNIKTVIAFDSAGNEQWVYDPPADDWITILALSNSGKIVFNDRASNGGGYTYYLNDDGTELWNYFTGLHYSYQPVIDMEGNIIAVGGLGNIEKIHSINQAGNLNWIDDFFNTSPISIGNDNRIYTGGVTDPFGNYNPCIRAYSSEGSLIWSTELPSEDYEVQTEIIVGLDESIYFGAMDMYNENGALYKVDFDGNIQWVNYYQNVNFSTPAIASNGLIYFGCDDGNFYALNPDGSERWVMETSNSVRSSPSIDPSGIIYFSNEDGILFAVHGENGGLANSPWPMKQHDTKHTGSVDTLTVSTSEHYSLESQTVTISNFPNPFHNETLISYNLPEELTTECSIFDIHGTECYKWGKCNQKAGSHHLTWNKQTKHGKSASPGIYTFILKTNNGRYSKKIVVQ